MQYISTSEGVLCTFLIIGSDQLSVNNLSTDLYWSKNLALYSRSNKPLNSSHLFVYLYLQIPPKLIVSVIDHSATMAGDKSHSPQRVCVSVHILNTFLFSPWDDGELLLFTSSSLCGGELLSHLKMKVICLKFLR